MTMTTRNEKHRGKWVGPKWNTNPNAYRGFRRPEAPRELTEDEAARALEAIQALRPLEPPDRRKGRS